MTWRSAIRAVAIALNALLAVWLFANAAVWGPGDYLGRAVVTIPPLLAIVALLQKR
jgi:hypothetical protein